MTDEEVHALYDKLKEYYGDKLADVEVFPKVFQHQVKMYHYYKGSKNENSDSDGPRN